MFIPEYTVTPNILKNISEIEYSRAIIDTTPILDSFSIKLFKKSLKEFISDSLSYMGDNYHPDIVSRHVDDIVFTTDPKIISLGKAYNYIEQKNINLMELENYNELQSILCRSSDPAKYRNYKIDSKTDPEQILAEFFDLISWIRSVDFMESNAIISSGILKGAIESMQPFENNNFVFANLISKLVLVNKGYRIYRYISMENYYLNNIKDYDNSLGSIRRDEDFTVWLEFYTKGFSEKISSLMELFKVYAKDTKLSKINSKMLFSPRQEKILTYLQDFGFLQNKDFSKIFPNISEDTVLRELNKLVENGIIVKSGSTKSSKYELA